MDPNCLPGLSAYGHRRKKTCLRGWRTTKAQTSLRIRADCSAPLLFAFWKYHISKLATSEMLVSVADEAGFSLALSETPKTGFVEEKVITSMGRVKGGGVG